MMKNNGSIGGDTSRIKYSAIKPDNVKCEANVTEKSPLLENIESMSISSPTKKMSPEVRNKKADVQFDDEESRNNHVDDNKDKVKYGSQNERGIDAEPNKSDESGVSSRGARPKVKQSVSSPTTSGGSDETHGRIDIVRKMSEPRSLNFVPWRIIGSYQTLKLKKCQRLYAATGRHDDLALFFHNGVFYIMEAWCTHMGGPLFEGDIEDYNGKCHVMCPWHSYMFDLETGRNEIGLQQKVHELKLDGGKIYVKYHTEISTETNRKASMATGPRVINRPPEGKHEKLRKQSVLDTPLKLA